MTRRKLPVTGFLEPPPCPDCGARFVNAELRHADSCPAGNSLDEITQDDARYFEENPGDTPCMPGQPGMAALRGP